MRVLVTGGAGFIGSHIVDTLLARGDQVHVIDDLSSGHREYVADDARFFEGSLLDQHVLSLAMEECEVVFHHAAHRAVFRSVEHPMQTNDANIGGSLAVLETARRLGVRRVVSASSSSVYGGAEQLPTPETAPLLPRSPYAVSKLAAEHYSRVYSELHDLETVSLRYFNVFGPRMRPDSQYALVIPLFIEALTTGQAPIVHGDGGQSRDFTYITDVTAANLAAAAAPAAVCSGNAYNIGRSESHSLLELLGHLRELLEVDIAPHHTASRAGDVRHTCADASAAQRELDHHCDVGFREGLELMLRAHERVTA